MDNDVEFRKTYQMITPDLGHNNNGEETEIPNADSPAEHNVSSYMMLKAFIARYTMPPQAVRT